MQRGATQQLVRTRWGAIVLGALSATLSWQLARYTPLSTAASRRAMVAPKSAPDLSEPSPRLDGLFEVAAEPDGAPLKLPGNLRCGRTEMGVEITASTGRYALQGPSDNPDPHLARPVPGRGFPTAPGSDWRLGTPQVPIGSAGPTAAFGRESTLGTDATHAIGQMWGDEVDEDVGENGLGRLGEAGSVVKRFDIAPLAENATAELRVVHTGLQVAGARKASEVGRVMAAHFAAFRACGQAELGDKQGEQRSVTVDFDVLPHGRVVASSAGTNALEQCLDRALSSVSFAASDDSTTTHVAYPLHFAAAGGGLKDRGVPTPVVRERCDCGG
ncbi:MAG TPA: hypothetical protein VHP33_05450 [Polyangiaceae bacterium]|nr:hypothetical protein [Polyangiaceae bacterium]